MRKTIFLLLITFSIALTSFTTTNQSQSLDDTPEAGIGLLSGSNTVQVHLSRSGADAGTGCVTFEVDISFNDGASVQTFTFTMWPNETYRSDVVQGPNPTAFADVIAVREVHRNCY
jgi:hypothetical protein